MVERLHQGEWFGATGQSITDVVHIGVGGSDLGPQLVSEALADRPSYTRINLHYVSSMDGAQLLPLMESLDPAKTLLVLVSKSFTTADTQFNVQTALTWLSESLELDVPKVCCHQLVGAWNCQFLNIPTHVMLPYDSRLRSLPAYLQQLEMESNGKSVYLNGRAVTHATCPIIWGDVGPNAQHAFYQLLHQGGHTVSADFVAVAEREVVATQSVQALMAAQEQLTLANCLAQAQLFALGDDAIPTALRGYMAQGYRGNQPNSLLLLKRLDAWSIGALLALYEHKVFVQSVLWDLNPFDQPGVELGKQLATSLYQTLTGEPLEYEVVQDPSTEQLVQKIGEWRRH